LFEFHFAKHESSLFIALFVLGFLKLLCFELLGREFFVEGFEGPLGSSFHFGRADLCIGFSYGISGFDSLCIALAFGCDFDIICSPYWTCFDIFCHTFKRLRTCVAFQNLGSSFHGFLRVNAIKLVFHIRAVFLTTEIYFFGVDLNSGGGAGGTPVEVEVGGGADEGDAEDGGEDFGECESHGV